MLAESDPAGWRTTEDHEIKHARRSIVWPACHDMQLLSYSDDKYDPPRTRTVNLRLQNPMPYPLGQRAMSDLIAYKVTQLIVAVAKEMLRLCKLLSLWLKKQLDYASYCSCGLRNGDFTQIIVTADWETFSLSKLL